MKEDGSPVIIDFGRATAEGDARGRPTVNNLQEARAHYRWIDPDVIKGKVLPSRATDVYSYGYLVGRVSRHVPNVQQQHRNKLYNAFKYATAPGHKRMSLSQLMIDLTQH